MNILYFDIENTPLLGYSWSTYQTNLLSVEKDSVLLSVAYKINDEPTQVMSLRTNTERQMVKKLHKLFTDADVIVAQNGDSFDIKMSNKYFAKYHLKPPAPYKTIDTRKIAKKHFRFPMNSLDYMSQFLLNQKKMETGGIDLWFRCMKGDEEALLLMERYNIHDVDLLYKLYQELKPWHNTHPNLNLYHNTNKRCPNCGGLTQKRGHMFTRVGKYQRYQCTSCGAWSKGDKINHDKVIS